MSFMEDWLDKPLRQVLPVMQQRIMEHTTYFGVTALKNPLDFWVYQEMICQLKPDVILEIGNRCGGGTLALAHLCDALGKGKIIALDITHELLSDVARQHPRITWIEGDACTSYNQVIELITENDQVLVIEDSAHTYENTLNVLRTYGPLVKPGGYFIVEDGICHHGLDIGPQPGPYEAVESFLAENSTFALDRGKENFLITWNPKGFLQRVI